MFLNRPSIEKRINMVRTRISELGISNDLRGWSYANPPVKPMRDTLLSVSELAARYCPTMRDIYLKRVMKTFPPHNYKMFRGIAYHELISSTILESKRYFYTKGIVSGSEFYEDMINRVSDLVNHAMMAARSRIGNVGDDEAYRVSESAVKLCKYLLIEVAHSVNQTLSRFPHTDVDSLVSESVPPITEMKVDGSLVGLSRELSIDLYSPINAVIDVKTGDIRGFHRLAPTGYALAIEADKGIPVDIGIVAYLSIEEHAVPKFLLDVFPINDELRREFLEIRDEAQLLVSKGVDPGMPAYCPEYCPYFTHCNRDSI